MAGELAGKVAVITGGASGIGKGTARRFVEEGALVVLADIDAAGEDVAREFGAEAAFRRCDVASPADVEALVDFAVSRFGALDIMFNNAGISEPLGGGSLLDRDFSDFDRIIRVDLLGVMLGTRFAALQMVKSGGGGCIINTASIGGMGGGVGLAVYRAAKAGVINFTEGASMELGPYDIRVNAISPGPIETPILLGGLDLPPEQAAIQRRRMLETMASGQAIARLGQPEDIGNAAVFLASARAAQITGHNLVVSGGTSSGLAKKIDTVQAGATV